jgi:hypothetical protein
MSRTRSILTVTLAAVTAFTTSFVVTGLGPQQASPGGATPELRHHSHWVNTWTAMPQLTEPHNMPPAPFTQDDLVLADATLRQTVHTSIGGAAMRLRFSNAFGGAELPITAVSVAEPLDGQAGVSAVEPGTSRPVTFHGNPSTVVPVGAQVVSDPLRFPVGAQENLTITVYLADGQASTSITSANLYELREAEFTNLLYATQGRAATNHLADVTDARFADDQAMSDFYNNTLAGGKWHGFQTQPKIGYGDIERYGPNAPWQQPERDHRALPDEVYPAVRRIDLPDRAELGVAIDGSANWWPDEQPPAVLPTFSPFQSQPRQYIEVFNRGSRPLHYEIRPGRPWVVVDNRRGTVDGQVRATLRVDFSRAPRGRSTAPITVMGPDGTSVEVQAVVDNPRIRWRRPRGFVEANGYVSIHAEHFSRRVNANGVH